MVNKIMLENGEEFFVREITLFKGTSEEYDTLVGGTDLSCVLMHDDNDIPEWEKEEIDDNIVFFVEPEKLLEWSDEELAKYVEKEIA